MKKFKDLNPNESKTLDLDIYRNALRLRKDALFLANSRQSFSTATSLLILSSEEVIKSILVRLHAENYNVYKLKESNDFFFKHKIRHQIAQLIEVGSGIIESMIKYDEQNSSKLLENKVKWLDNLVNGFVDIVNATKPLLNSSKRIEDIKGFNNLKNIGFYVDYKDGLIDPKVEINEEVYKKTLLLTQRIFSFSKGLRILFHEKLDNHILEDEIIKGKVTLNDFIDTTLKDFSFKKMDNILK